MTDQDHHPDNYEEFCQLRDYRAWYEANAAAKARWDKRQAEMAAQSGISKGEMVGIAFTVASTALVCVGVLAWAFGV